MDNVQKFHYGDYVEWNMYPSKGIVTRCNLDEGENINTSDIEYQMSTEDGATYNWIKQEDITLISSQRLDILARWKYELEAVSIIKKIPLIHNEDTFKALVEQADTFLVGNGFKLERIRGYNYSTPKDYWNYTKRPSYDERQSEEFLLNFNYLD